MTSEVRVGLIGYGLAGSVFHGPLIAATAGMRLCIIVTGNAERAAQARREHPGADIVDRPERLWERAAELDLAVVASPNITHVPYARAALRAGLAVVVDKPFAASAAEGQELIEEARRRKRLLSVFQNRRWDGDFLTLRRLLAEGALGDVHRYESRFERWRPVPKQGWRESGNPAEAGGTLYDLGSHLIDQALVLWGPVARVYGEVDHRRPGVEVDDDAFVALEHASGVRSHLWMNATAPEHDLRMRVQGSRAAYVKHGLDVQEAALKEGVRPGYGWGAEPEERWGRVGVADGWAPVPMEPGAWPAYYAGIAAALREGAPPPVDPDDAVAGLRIIEAARRSAAEHRVIELA